MNHEQLLYTLALAAHQKEAKLNPRALFSIFKRKQSRASPIVSAVKGLVRLTRAVASKAPSLETLVNIGALGTAANELVGAYEDRFKQPRQKKFAAEKEANKATEMAGRALWRLGNSASKSWKNRLGAASAAAAILPGGSVIGPSIAIHPKGVRRAGTYLRALGKKYLPSAKPAPVTTT